MVGRHLLSLLANEGLAGATACRQKPQDLSANFSWQTWSLQDWKTPEELDLLFPDVDALFHVGALLPGREGPSKNQQMLEANVRGTLCLAEWAFRKKIPVIYLSGATVYSESIQGPLTEKAQKTFNGVGGFYGLSKLMGEEVLQHFALQGLKVSILRASSIYGSGLAPDKMISLFLRAATEGKSIKLTQPVNDRINLIHASDVAMALLSTARKEAWGEFNIGGSLSTVLEIAETCVKVVGQGQVEISQEKAARAPLTRFDLCSDLACATFDFSIKTGLKPGITQMWLDQKGRQL